MGFTAHPPLAMLILVLQLLTLKIYPLGHKDDFISNMESHFQPWKKTVFHISFPLTTLQCIHKFHP